MENSRWKFFKLHDTHFKIWGDMRWNIAGFLKIKRMLWFNIIPFVKSLKKGSGHLVALAPCKKGRFYSCSPALQPGHYLLWIIPQTSLHSALGAHLLPALLLVLLLFTLCFAKFPRVQISESLWKLTGGGETLVCSYVGLNEKYLPETRVLEHWVPSWWCCLRKFWNLRDTEPGWSKYTMGAGTVHL